MKRIPYIVLVLIVMMSPAYPASVTFTIGEVRIKSADTWHDAKIGMKVGPGDTVETLRRSLVIIDLDNGRIVKLYPGTKCILVPNEKSPEKSLLDLVHGTVFAKILKSGDAGGLSIRYNTIVASVRGTHFYMALHKRLLFFKDLWICVNEGAVNVNDMTRDTSVTIKEGEGIRVKGGAALTEPKMYEWTKKIYWNMDPSRGPVIEKEFLDKGSDVFGGGGQY